MDITNYAETTKPRTHKLLIGLLIGFICVALAGFGVFAWYIVRIERDIQELRNPIRSNVAVRMNTDGTDEPMLLVMFAPIPTEDGGMPAYYPVYVNIDEVNAYTMTKAIDQQELES